MNNTFQVIGGKHRGRKFKFPDVDGLRPSPNKVRETLFNWLQFEMGGKTFLDLFAGSGALSFEALSRGAKSVTGVEKNAKAFGFLQDNQQVLKVDNLMIFNQDAFDFLREEGTPFDFILLDPPFYKNYLEKVLTLIIENGFIDNGSKIYIESEFEVTDDFLNHKFIINKQKKSGAVHYCLLENL